MRHFALSNRSCPLLVSNFQLGRWTTGVTMPKQLILCDCLGSQALDGEALANATGFSCSRVYSCLCTDQLDIAEAAISAGDAIIACQQERHTFETLAEEIGAQAPEFLDLRDRAGWTGDERPTLAKMAALIAEAGLATPEAKSVDVISQGVCLIIGAADVAFKAAAELCETLNVTVLVSDDCDLPADRRFDIVRGTIKSVKGALGGFEVRIDGLQKLIPGGRGAPQLSAPKDGGQSGCDIVLDLSGAAPLVTAPEKREGYLCADPQSLEARASAVLQASQLVGTFEKLLHVRLEAPLCAHSRAEKTGCSKCLDICPTGAIMPNGDHVAIDPMICAGCGACSAVCPSGAITFDAPPVLSTFRRIETLASTYRHLAADPPRLLVHDGNHGAELIALAARYGRGMPSDVIPLEVAALAAFGHAEMLAALACGFASVAIIMAPRFEREAIEREAALAAAIAGDGKITLMDHGDADLFADALYDAEIADSCATPILPMGTRRQITRLAAKALRQSDEIIALPEQAPYGNIIVDQDACTLCLSCVSLCPSGALGDNADMPQVRFQEDACLQCGICATICPETAIALEPRLNLADNALSQQVLNQEEPFACVECGALFGVKSTVERITAQLAGKHSMFASADAARMIQMCDNCRIDAQYHAANNPFASAERPRVRTSDDYRDKSKDH